MATVSPVVVRYDAANNQYGRVYHRPECWHVGRMYGHREMSWEDASESGRTACLHCHTVRYRNFICPICENAPGGGSSILMIPVSTAGSAVIHLQCPNCGIVVHQHEEER